MSTPSPTGYAALCDPRRNKSTAFREQERRGLGLEGSGSVSIVTNALALKGESPTPCATHLMHEV